MPDLRNPKVPGSSPGPGTTFASPCKCFNTACASLTVRRAIYIIYFLSSFAMMTSWIFVPRFIVDMGGDHGTVGFAVGAYNGAGFVASIMFGRLADIHGRRLFIKAGLLASAFSFLLQPLAPDPLTFTVVRALAGFSAGMFPPALISLAHYTTGRIGRFSSFGSLGWAGGAFGAGLVAEFSGIPGAFYVSSALFFTAFLISFRVEDVSVASSKPPLLPFNLLGGAPHIFTAFFLRHIGAQMAWTYWVLYLRDLGAGDFWQGAMMGLNAATQFFAMFFLMDRGRASAFILTGFLVSSAVFLGFYLSPTYLYLIPLQFALGISWSMSYVGTLRTLMERFREKATATGLLGSVLSMAGIAGPFLAPEVLSLTGGYRGIMAVSAVLSLLAALTYGLYEFWKKSDEARLATNQSEY